MKIMNPLYACHRLSITPVRHYAITPLLHYSNETQRWALSLKSIHVIIIESEFVFENIVY
jgi:hypothetical protein